MTQGNGGHGVDSSTWRATILPLPKRHSRGAALGFCGGHVVGRVEAARGPSRGCWWPDGNPELLGLEGHEELGAGRAAGDLIPGNWRMDAGDMGAVVWRLSGTLLEGRELHDPAFAKTWATGAGGGAVIGIGARPSQPGKRMPNVGLVWRDGTDAAVIEAEGEVRLFATDGVRVAGSINGRAALWPSIGAAPIDLSPAKMAMSEVEALDGDSQVGTAFKGFCARAGIWRGAAATFSDLTPKGFQTSRAHGGAGGFQVGYVRVKENTRNGTPGSDNRAVVWEGAADRWFDLNALLPAPYNASIALAIEIRGNELRICGSASQVEVNDPGTPRESHVVPVDHPVLWTARIRSGG